MVVDYLALSVRVSNMVKITSLKGKDCLLGRFLHKNRSKKFSLLHLHGPKGAPSSSHREGGQDKPLMAEWPSGFGSSVGRAGIEQKWKNLPYSGMFPREQWGLGSLQRAWRAAVNTALATSIFHNLKEPSALHKREQQRLLQTQHRGSSLRDHSPSHFIPFLKKLEIAPLEVAVQNLSKIPRLQQARKYPQKEGGSKGQQYFYKKPCNKTEQIRIKHIKLIINSWYLLSDKLKL